MPSELKTEFPDGTVWRLNPDTYTLTSIGPRGDYSWTFDNEMEATLAWVEVCLK